MVDEREVGRISHYYSKIGVAVIELSDTLKVGEVIHVRGASSDFSQPVDSMQIERASVPEAKAGESIGLKVKEHVREHDKVFAVAP